MRDSLRSAVDTEPGTPSVTIRNLGICTSKTSTMSSASWLSSPAQAIARVRLRVRQGGHHVPAVDIRRRFKRSLAHLLNDYLPLATRWAVWDSRGLPAKRLAISSVDDIQSVRHLIGT